MDTRPITSFGTRSTLAGVFGELIALEELTRLDWKVEHPGGFGRGHDLLACDPTGHYKAMIQVKATTKKLGIINWAKPGAEGVRKFVEAAGEAHAIAIMVLIHAEPADASFIGDDLLVKRPQVLAITACTAQTWAKKVDEARLEYSKRLRKRRKEGQSEYLPESGCIHPCAVDDFAELPRFLSTTFPSPPSSG